MQLHVKTFASEAVDEKKMGERPGQTSSGKTSRGKNVLLAAEFMGVVSELKQQWHANEAIT